MKISSIPQGIFEDDRYTDVQRIEYFKKHPEDISFITAIEA